MQKQLGVEKCIVSPERFLEQYVDVQSLGSAAVSSGLLKMETPTGSFFEEIVANNEGNSPERAETISDRQLERLKLEVDFSMDQTRRRRQYDELSERAQTKEIWKSSFRPRKSLFVRPDNYGAFYPIPDVLYDLRALDGFTSRYFVNEEFEDRVKGALPTVDWDEFKRI